MFLHFLTLMWSIAFLCLASCSSYATLSQVGLFKVPLTYLGSLGYFHAWGPVFARWPPLRKAIINRGGGFDMCSLLSLVMYPKHAHSTSLMQPGDYWGLRCRTP
jgi:hypothetical protein